MGVEILRVLDCPYQFAVAKEFLVKFPLLLIPSMAI